MRIVRYQLDGVHHGEVRGEMIYPLEGEFGMFEPSSKSPVSIAQVQLLTPSVPRKIVAVGPNYKAHLLGGPPPPRPHYWIKPPNTFLAHEGVIEIPDDVPMTCHESELAVVIGKTCRNVSVSDAAEHIFGYTCINDVTAGALTDPDAYVGSQYFVDGKIYDTFAAFGPYIETELDPSDIRIQCRVNGQTRQDHRTSDMIWRPTELLSLISHVLTLYPGDVIATGSPPGPGPLAAGDVIEVDVEGVGILRNTVAQRV